MRNDTGDSMEKAVKESTIFKEEVAEVFINGENTMPVGDIDQLEGHAGGTFHRVLIAASGAETAVTTEGNEFKFPAFRTAIHGTAIRRVTTMNHLLDVFNHSVARMKSIYHFFIMISEDFLQNIHMISMKKRGTKSNPLMNEGAGGAEVPKALFYSSSRNTRDFNHEIRVQSETLLHREYNLAMKNKSLSYTMLHRSIVTHA